MTVPNRTFYGELEECKRPYGANTVSRGFSLSATNMSVPTYELQTSDRSGNYLHKMVRGSDLSVGAYLPLDGADFMDTLATGITNSY